MSCNDITSQLGYADSRPIKTKLDKIINKITPILVI